MTDGSCFDLLRHGEKNKILIDGQLQRFIIAYSYYFNYFLVIRPGMIGVIFIELFICVCCCNEFAQIYANLPKMLSLKYVWDMFSCFSSLLCFHLHFF